MFGIHTNHVHINKSINIQTRFPNRGGDTLARKSRLLTAFIFNPGKKVTF